MAYNQNDILTTLAYLQGERSVNATTSAPRADFIQTSLQEAYSAYPWRFARALATVVFTNGIATLPTNYDIAQPVHATFNNGSDVTIQEVNDYDEELYGDGDRATIIYPVNDEATQYALKTADTNITAATVKYQKLAPVLDTAGTIKTPYPNKNTIALGARRYTKLGQNPDADISQDEKLFQTRLAADIAAVQVPTPRKKRRTIQNSTGDF